MFYKIIEQSKKKNKIIGVRFYDDNGYWYGKIQDFNDDIIQLECYTKYGVYDGIIVLEIPNIERIDFDDDHTNALEMLIENQNKLQQNKFKNRFFNELSYGEWQFEALKPYEGEDNFFVQVEISNQDYFIGTILKINEETFTFHCVGNLGENRGYSVFNVEDVTYFKIDDLECRKRYFLYQKNTNFIP